MSNGAAPSVYYNQPNTTMTPTRPAPPPPTTTHNHSLSPQHTALSSSSSASHNPLSQSASVGAGQSYSSVTIVRRGWVTVKEEGLRSWIWSKRWLTLKPDSLTLYKNEVCQQKSAKHPAPSLTRCRVWCA